MFSSILCVMTGSGHPLTDDIRTLLFRESVKLFRSGKNRTTFSFEDCEGRITTDYRIGMIGMFGGPMFSAEIEHEGGKTTVRYVIDSDRFDEDLSHVRYSTFLQPEGLEIIPGEYIQ